MKAIRRASSGYYRAWEPYGVTTEALQRSRYVKRRLPSRRLLCALRLVEGPPGGVLFLLLLAATIVLWFGGAR